MSIFEYISIILSGISTLTVVVGFWLAVKNLNLFVKSHADNHEWSRRLATKEALLKFYDLNIETLNEEFGYSNNLKPIDLEILIEKFEKNPSLQIACHRLLNFYEGLASGIHLGIYDELTIKVAREFPMERDFTKFRKYIEYRRDTVNSATFVSQEKLINDWRKMRLSESDRNTTGNII